MYLWHVCTDFAQFVDDHAPLSLFVQKNKHKNKISRKRKREREKDESIRQIPSIKMNCAEWSAQAQAHRWIKNKQTKNDAINSWLQMN